jgi:hypothetical protein
VDNLLSTISPDARIDVRRQSQKSPTRSAEASFDYEELKNSLHVDFKGPSVTGMRLIASSMTFCLTETILEKSNNVFTAIVKVIRVRLDDILSFAMFSSITSGLSFERR